MRALVLVPVLLLVPTLAAAADVAAPSTVDAVTVYAGSARVVRAAEVTLSAGDARVLFENLPAALVDDSLRVQGQGAARAQVYGVEVELVTQAEAPEALVRAAQQRVDELHDQDRALDDRIHAAEKRRELVDGLRSTYDAERAKNLTFRPVATRELVALAELVMREQLDASEQIRRAQIAKRELARQLQAAEAALAQLDAKGGTTSKRVAVNVRADKAGPFRLELSYLVPQAGWTPVWDARLDPEKEEVTLSLYAQIQQTTGEDWAGARLAASTASASTNLYVPELGPVYLEPYRVSYDDDAPSGGGYASGSAAPSAMEREDAPRSTVSRAPSRPPPVMMERPVARVSHGLLSATFTAPRRESVDGAGKPRKVYLAAWRLKGQLARVAAPRIEPRAFLTATLQNNTGIPLLAGAASVFLGDEFLGKTSLPATPQGDELRLAFGADDRVKLERKMVERHHEVQGFLSKEDVIRYRFLTTVKNLYGRSISVRILDQLPVSRDERVKVKLLSASTPPPEKEDPMKPGVREHRRTLPPNAEQTIELRYEVRFPRGLALSGLE